MFNKNKCCQCGKTISSKKTLKFYEEGGGYCPKCFEREAISRIETAHQKTQEAINNVCVLKKRLKNKGTKVWVVLDFTRGERTRICTGTIYNRTEDECGVRFTDESVLEEYDIAEDFVTLFFPWNKIYLSHVEATIALHAKRSKDNVE